MDEDDQNNHRKHSSAGPPFSEKVDMFLAKAGMYLAVVFFALIGLYGVIVLIASAIEFLKVGSWPHVNLDEIASHFFPDLGAWKGLMMILSFIPVWAACLFVSIVGLICLDEA